MEQPEKSSVEVDVSKKSATTKSKKAKKRPENRNENLHLGCWAANLSNQNVFVVFVSFFTL